MSAAQIAARLAVGGPGAGALQLHKSHTARRLYNRVSELCSPWETDTALSSSRLGADAIRLLSEEGRGCHMVTGGHT